MFIKRGPLMDALCVQKIFELYCLIWLILPPKTVNVCAPTKDCQCVCSHPKLVNKK